MTQLTGLALAVSRSFGAKGAPAPRTFFASSVDGRAAAEIVVLVGDASGRVIGELDADVTGVAWKLSDYGQLRMTLPRSGATATERLLRPGNRVMVQFNNGLPDWGGILDLPRKWEDGRIGVVGYSAERILVDRVTSRGRYFTQAAAGHIFRSLLNEAEPMGIDVGEVWMGGEPHSPSYHYRSLYDIFTKSLSSRIETADWDVVPALKGGRITFRANYYERRGRDHGRKLAFLEGVNLTGVSLQEQGPIVNHWLLAGAGTGWGETTRIYAAAKSEHSAGRYGLRQRGEVRVDVVVQTTLDRSAEVALAGSEKPHPVVSLSSIDLPPARWHQYDVGDSVLTEIYSAGFEGYETSVRIVAREYLPAAGVCSLVVDEEL